MVGAYALGIYPRSPRLIEATRVNHPKLEELFKKEREKFINLEKRINFTYIADPMLSWNDMFRPFTNVKGITLGALNRFFETNTFYRKLVIKDELKGYGKIVASNISIIKGKTAVSMPDPYTFAELNENAYYKNYEEYILAIAHMLNKEAQTLSKEGVVLIQLNSPSLAYNTNELNNLHIIKEAIEKVKNKVSSKVYLHLYFGNVTKIFDKLLDIKVDGLSIDLVNNSIEDIMYDVKGKGLALGIINTTNTRMEDLRMARMINDALEKMNPKEAYICTNADLEFLPYEFAIKKMFRLGSIAKKVRYDGKR